MASSGISALALGDSGRPPIGRVANSNGDYGFDSWFAPLVSALVQTGLECFSAPPSSV